LRLAKQAGLLTEGEVLSRITPRELTIWQAAERLDNADAPAAQKKAEADARSRKKR
jgi:hypothetical protein